VKLTWVGRPTPLETKVTRIDAPNMLEYGDIRWELEASGGGTRLTLWHKIDRRFIAWGAAGWHICFDVLGRLLAGDPIGRIAGTDAMKFGGWQRLNAEYAKQFGIETPKCRRRLKRRESRCAQNNHPDWPPLRRVVWRWVAIRGERSCAWSSLVSVPTKRPPIRARTPAGKSLSVAWNE
jgi:hypothetical protein